MTKNRSKGVQAERPVIWVAIAALAALLASCGSSDDSASGDSVAEAVETTIAAATEVASPFLSSTEIGNVTVHTFHRASGENATYAIESANAVVVIDTQFKSPHPEEFRAAVDGLGKPIGGLFVTHQHADHIGGLDGAFSDVQILATPAVAESLAAEGRDIETIEGAIEIDGVEFVITEVLKAEAGAQMFITVADGQGVFTGDLVSHSTHGVLGRSIGNWISTLEGLADTPVEHVFPGHGIPAGPEIIDENIVYLQTAGELLASSTTAAEYTDALIAAFPDHLGPPLIAFYAENLVGEQLLG